MVMETTMEQLEFWYKFGIEASAWTVGTMVIGFTLFRLLRLFIAFSRGDTLNSFDESCIIDWGEYEVGNDPMGIVVDFVILGCLGGLGCLAWPAFWPIFTLTFIAFYLRRRNLEAQAIMNRLKS